MSCLAISNLSYQYGGHSVIKQLDLQVGEDEILCLLGASGCGKTTALKAIAGLVDISQGVIKIGDRIVNDERIAIAPEQRNIGMMFQDYALFPHLTVADNIMFGLANMSKGEKERRLAEMLELVKLTEFGERYPHQLSGGQQQRVAIARALAYRPNLLLLDEPFSNIDTQVRFELISDIRRIVKSQGVSAVFVSHSKEEAFAFADTLAIMDSGKIVQQGSIKQLFNQPSSKKVAEFLGSGIYLSAKVLTATEYQTPLGIIVSTAVDSNSLGEQGQLYIRPQYITLQVANDSEHYALVEHKRFIGTGYVYRIAVFGQQLEVATNEQSVFAVGDKVALTIMQHVVNFFPE